MSQEYPHSQEAEKSLLGSLLLDPRLVAAAYEALTPEDFYFERHQIIFEAICTLFNQGHPLDLVTLADALESMGKLEAVGSLAYLTDLTLATPSAVNAPQYIRIIESRSVLRALINAGNEIIRNAKESEHDVAQSLDFAEKRIFNISLKKATDTLLPIRPTLQESYLQIGERMLSAGGPLGVPTGFADLDRKLGGLQRSDLIIIAGRPSMGKTSFAVNIAQYAGVHGNAAVAIFSLEMSREQLVTRMLCSEAEVDMQNVKSGALSPAEMDRLADVLVPLSGGKIHIDDSAGVRIGEIRSKCRRLKLEHGLDLLVIDYLQLMQPSEHMDSRLQEISELTRSLKLLARDLDVPVVVLSQLSRAPDQRSEHHPMLSDLRESGTIEQDADIVIMLYREQVYDPSADNTTEVIIAKNRNGPTGTVKVAWLGEYTKFKNLAQFEQA